MRFLNPWGLLGLTLAVPILLLYFLRLQRPQRPVPSLFLWEAVLSDRYANRPWQRLRPNLLLLLQLLVLLMLVLALARPALPRPRALHGHVIVLVDGSASMQTVGPDGRTRFEQARMRLRSLLADVEPEGRLSLILVAATPRLVVGSGTAMEVRQALDDLQPTDGVADWSAAAALTAGLAGGGDVTTLVATDGAFDEPLPALPGTVRLVQVGEAQPNVGIAAFSLRRGPEGMTAFARLVATGGAAERREVALYADGALLDRRTVEVPAEGETTLTFAPLPPLQRAELRLLPADAFAVDDAAWVALEARQSGRVLLVTQGNRFLTQAMAAWPDVEVVESRSLPPEADEAGLVIVDGPFTGTLPSRANLWLIAPSAASPCGEPTQPFTPTNLLKWAQEAPLLRYTDWSDVHIGRAMGYVLPPSAEVLVQDARGPLLWTVAAPERRLLCQAFDLHDSDLPLRLAFPLLVANVIDELLPAHTTAPIVPRPAGLPWTPSLPEGASRARLYLPDGKSLPLQEGRPLPTSAGLYRIEATVEGRPWSQWVALSLTDGAESRIAPRSVRVGTASLPDVSTLPPGWRDMSRLFLLAALLFLLVEGVFWFAPFFPHLREPTELVFRLALVAALLLAFFRVGWAVPSRDLRLVFLLDRSASVAAHFEREVALVEEALAKKRPDDAVGIIVFGADAWVDRPLSTDPALLPIATQPDETATDLEEALRLALALIPQDAPGRIVVVSDGVETVGDAAQALLEARWRGVDVRWVGLPGATGDEVWLDRLSVPAVVYPGDEVAVEVVVGSTSRQEAALSWSLNGERGSTTVEVGGERRFQLHLRASAEGFLPLKVCLTPPEGSDTFPQNNCSLTWLVVGGPPRLLVVGEGGERAALVAALRQAGLQVEACDPGVMPVTPMELGRYALVVLVDTPLRTLPLQAPEALQRFVRDLGGGLLAVGGPKAYGVGGWLGTPLEEALPVLMEVRDPDRFPPMTMAVVIDKSGSMGLAEGGVTKIRLAAEAAARAAEALNDTDTMVVVAYDDRPADTIGPMPLSQRDELVAQVMRLQAGGGGIYVYDSLAYARTLFESIPPRPDEQRHIILLADGSDAERQAGALELAGALRAAGVTLSVIAIGSGPDVPFLQQLAAAGGGRFYLTARASMLPTIFAEETAQAKRTYIVEETFYPQPQLPWGPIEGIEAVPPLRGYVATTAKGAAETIWITPQGDPLLAAWQYGLGRSVAWTSDATGRWAAGWVAWPEFSRFWGGIARWLVPPPGDEDVALSVRAEGDRAHVTADILAADGRYADGLHLTFRALLPTANISVSMPLEQVAAGRYEATFPLHGTGAYILQVRGDRAVTQAWARPYPEEYRPADAQAALARLAAFGGGEVLSPEAALPPVLRHDLHGLVRGRSLAPWLTLLALLFWPLDIAWRRLALRWRRVGAVLRALWDRLRHRPRRRPPAEPPVPPSSTTHRLREKVASLRRPSQRSVPPPSLGDAEVPSARSKPSGAGSSGETAEHIAARLKKRLRK